MNELGHVEHVNRRDLCVQTKEAKQEHLLRGNGNKSLKPKRFCLVPFQRRDEDPNYPILSLSPDNDHPLLGCE